MYTLVGKCFKYTNNGVPSHAICIGKVTDGNAIDWARGEVQSICFKKNKEWGQAYAVACLYHAGIPLTMFHLKMSKENGYELVQFNVATGKNG